MLDPRLVHWITAPPKRDDPAPREREPVRRHAVLLQQRDVLLPPPVRVRRDVARVPALGRAERVREGVPDGREAAVCGGRAFDLVTRCTCSVWSREGVSFGGRWAAGSLPVAYPQTKSLGSFLAVILRVIWNAEALRVGQGW